MLFAGLVGRFRRDGLPCPAGRFGSTGTRFEPAAADVDAVDVDAAAAAAVDVDNDDDAVVGDPECACG